jgi:hypothetical protein
VNRPHLSERKGNPVDPKRIAEIIAKLGTTPADVSDQDITDALAAIREQSTELAATPVTEDSVAGLRSLLDQKKTLLAAQAGRRVGDELSKAHADVLAELDGTHDPSRDHVQPDPEAAPVPEPGEGAPEGDRQDEQTPGEGEGDKEDKTGKGEEDKPAGKKRGSRQLADLGRGDAPPEPATGGVVTTVTKVQGSVPGMSPGQELGNAAALTRAFVDKAKAVNGTAAAGRHDVARVEFTYPPERVLEARSNESANMEKINAARGPQALTAAGGLCLPLEVRYDIETIGVTDRPIKAALSAFQVERGGLQYRAPFDALVMTSGLGVWTQADDVVSPLVPKTCFEVTCPGVLEASIYSTYLCLEFANMTARFDNEWVQATTESSQVAWARFAENQLLSRLASGSKIIRGEHMLGAVRDVLINFDRIAAYYRNRHRLSDEIALHMLAPRWLIDLFRADMAMQMPSASVTEQFNIAKATLETWLRTRNINVSWHLDGLNGATVSGIVYPNQWYADLAAGATVPEFPTSVDTLLWREGDWLFLDGGTLDLGLVRDSTLNLRNRYQTFIETFEGVAFIGKECLRLILPIAPSGASTGTIDPRAIDATLPVVAA